MTPKPASRSFDDRQYLVNPCAVKCIKSQSHPLETALPDARNRPRNGRLSASRPLDIHANSLPARFIPNVEEHS